jgi:hypothetical protein
MSLENPLYTIDWFVTSTGLNINFALIIALADL